MASTADAQDTRRRSPAAAAMRVAQRGAALRAEGRPERATWYLERARKRLALEQGEDSPFLGLIDLEIAESWRVWDICDEAARVAIRAERALSGTPEYARKAAEARAVQAMALLATKGESEDAMEMLAGACETLARIGQGSRIARAADVRLATSFVAHGQHGQAACLLTRRRDAESARKRPRHDVLEALDDVLVQALTQGGDLRGALHATRQAFLTRMEDPNRKGDRAWREFLERLCGIDINESSKLTTALYHEVVDYCERTEPRPCAVPTRDGSALELHVERIRRAARGPRSARLRAAAGCLRILPEVLEVLGPGAAQKLAKVVSASLWEVGAVRRSAVLSRRMLALLADLPERAILADPYLRDWALDQLVVDYSWCGRLHEAERGAYAFVDALRAADRPDWDSIESAMRRLARILSAQRRHDDAVGVLRDALGLPLPDDPSAQSRTSRAATRLALAEALVETGQRAEAVDSARASLSECEPSRGPRDPLVSAARCSAARVLARCGMLVEAYAVRIMIPDVPGRWRQGEEETPEQTAKRLRDSSEHCLLHVLDLAECDLMLGRADIAEESVRFAICECRVHLQSDGPHVGRTYRLLGEALLAQGRATTAVTALERAAAAERRSRFAAHPVRRRVEGLLAEARDAAASGSRARPAAQEGLFLA